jgi:hypothetical protein
LPNDGSTLQGLGLGHVIRRGITFIERDYTRGYAVQSVEIFIEFIHFCDAGGSLTALFPARSAIRVVPKAKC